MTTALYIIWALLPIFFFLMALWSFLEKKVGKKKHERPADLLIQGLFVTVCVIISLILDHYFLPSILESLLQGLIPYGVFQIMLLPFVLYVAAKIVGPSKPIQISKAPSVSRSRNNRD